MRARLLTIAVSICAMFSVRCSTNEATNDRARTVPQDTAASSQTATPAGKQLTDGQLRAALLTVQDMPTGFKLDTDSGNDDSGKFEGCERLAGLDQNTGSGPDIDVSFTKGAFGPFVSEALRQRGKTRRRTRSTS
jgi:hypothetical protein